MPRHLALVMLAACTTTDPVELDSKPDDSDTVITPDSDPIDTPTPSPTGDTSVAVPPPPDPPDVTGAFTDVSADIWAGGLFDLAEIDDMWPRASWVAFGDLDNDGNVDAYLAEVQSFATDLGRFRGQVFSWIDDGWVHDVEMSQRLQTAARGVSAIVDLDGDGDDDIVRGTSDQIAELNDGTGIFTPVSFVQPPDQPQVTGLNSLVVTDLDQDGWLDLLFGPDGCREVPVLPLVRTGTRTWTPMPELVPSAPDGDAYTLMTAPLGDGTQHLWFIGQECDVTNAPTGFARMGARDGDGWPTYTSTDLTPSDSLYRLSPESAGRPMTVRQPMGGAVVDRNLDGTLDIITALSDPQLHLFHGNGGPVMDDASVDADVQLPHGDAAKAQLPWGLSPTDFDADGRPDLFVMMGNDAATKFEVPYNGPYYPRAYWNNGPGYADVSAGSGLEIEGDWHTVVAFDFDGDADPDLGLGAWGFPPRLLRNELSLGNTLALRLQGTTSNPLAMGATVSVIVDGLDDQLRVVGEASSPEVFAKPDLYVGIGGATAADEVHITWPTGWTQVLRDLPGGELHTLVEPPTITLSEASRHLPADGSSELIITVTPRGEDGEVRAAAVSIEAPWGQAGFVGPATQDGDTWQRVLRAPSVQGTSVIEVTIDGTVSPIHPRVWWDPI